MNYVKYGCCRKYKRYNKGTNGNNIHSFSNHNGKCNYSNINKYSSTNYDEDTNIQIKSMPHTNNRRFIFYFLPIFDKSKYSKNVVFDPTGQSTYYWSFFVVGAFLYNLWVIGYRVGYFKEGVLQHNLNRIKQRYLNSTTFYLDCLAILPLDFLYLSLGYNSLLRIFRLIKIFKFWNFIDRTECNINYPNMFRTFILLHYLLVIFHWNSCVVYCVSQALNFNIPIRRNDTHLHDFNHPDRNKLSYMNIAEKNINVSIKHPHEHYGPGETLNLYRANHTIYHSETASPYLKSLFWSTLALTTIGDMPKPHSNGEHILSISQIILGLILFAYMLGQVSSLISTIRMQEREYQIQMDIIKTYMRKQDVPKKFRIKVCKWLNYNRLSKKSAQENKIINTLPNKLKAEMAIYVHLDTLRRVEIFQNTEAGFLRQLVLKLKPVLFSPGDYVCLKGEVGKEMYIVNTGILEIIGGQDNHTVLLILRAGSYFGEISVLNMGPYGNRRTASIRSVGYSELFSLSKDDLWEVLKEYPNARARLEDIASRRLSMAKTEGNQNHLVNEGNEPNGISNNNEMNDVQSLPDRQFYSKKKTNVKNYLDKDTMITNRKYMIPLISISNNSDTISTDDQNTIENHSPSDLEVSRPSSASSSIISKRTGNYLKTQIIPESKYLCARTLTPLKRLSKLNKSISYPYFGGIMQYASQSNLSEQQIYRSDNLK
ncbi:unnamed protein product [Gordionus sp. m RMFG-2023]|uniref:cyclic nucleotide-gated cation channel alpha-3-like isoform X2 n=1 Tax=Gordionus sp. m RMFG-2023 TaxID=3053472 RepID=UPI0030E323FD